MSDQDTVETPAPKKRGRPSRAKAVVAAVAAQGIAPTQEQWAQLLDGLRANKHADLEVAATIHAQAMKKALRPENETPPLISVYNPRGETAYPREKPTHIYMIGPYPICDPGNYDTTTATEIALLNQLKPGIYTVTKANAAEVKVLVKSETDGAGKPYRTVLFADGKGIMDDEQKHDWTSLVQILTEMTTGEKPAASFARYQAQIDALKQQVASLTAA